MKKLILQLSISFSFYSISTAQTFPTYHITALDTSQSEGYYFLSAQKFGSVSPLYPLQLILDRYGRIVYLKNFPATAGAADFKIQPNGLISYSGQMKFYLCDSTLNVVDSVSCRNGWQTDGHDLQVLPNGHYLLLGNETVTMDLSSYNMFNHNGSPGSSTASVKCGVVQELDANKNVVFEWHAKDHYSFADVDENFLNSPMTVDWTHFNAVEMDTGGNILVSVRHFNEITKINRSDSSIIWRLGGKQNQFTFTNDTGKFKGQHDIRRISNGHITLFDNGEQAFPLHAASAKEYQLNETTMTATLAWSYTENANSFSRSTGNVQRLSSGNTLVDFGNMTNTNFVFNVVEPAGNKIFEIVFPDSATSYRAFNYPALPWQLPRPVISCYFIAGQYYLDAGAGYSSYLWSTGDTTQSIQVTSADTFNVFVPLNNGGYISSEYFEVSGISNPCGPVALEEIEKASFDIYPNPVDETLFVKGFSLFGSNKISIYNILTEVVFSSDYTLDKNNNIQFDVSGLQNGIYFLRIGDQMKRFIKTDH